MYFYKLNEVIHYFDLAYILAYLKECKLNKEVLSQIPCQSHLKCMRPNDLRFKVIYDTTEPTVKRWVD